MTTGNSVDFRTRSRSVFPGKAEKAVSSQVAGSGGVARLSAAASTPEIAANLIDSATKDAQLNQDLRRERCNWKGEVDFPLSVPCR